MNSTIPTKNEPKHTPTPWAIMSEPFQCKTDGGNYWKINIIRKGLIVASAEGYSPEAAYINAAFIVRACNAHDELVVCLNEQAIFWRSEMSGRSRDNWPYGYAMLNRIETTLAKARGEA